MKTKNLKGLSLSFCIKDILDNLIYLDRVAYIETNTRCETDEDWYQLFEIYAKTYWRKFPEKAIALVQEFRKNKQIYQPRMMYDSQRSISEGHWVLIDSQGREQDYFNPYS